MKHSLSSQGHTDIRLAFNIHRSINSIHRLINGINRLINGIDRVVNGISPLIDGIVLLINGLGLGRVCRAAAGEGGGWVGGGRRPLARGPAAYPAII